MARNKGAKSVDGLTQKEQEDFIREWLDDFKPKNFREALHKLAAIRIVRAMATPNSTALASILDKAMKANWTIRTGETKPTFVPPGEKKSEQAG